MKLEVLRESLHKMIVTVFPAVTGKSLPLLNNILLAASDDGRLTLSATNLETGITTSAAARVESAGSVTLPAKLLVDLVAGLPNKPITLELNEQSQVVSLRSERFKTELHGLSSDEYPVFPTSAGDPVLMIDGAIWHEAIESVGVVSSEIAGTVLSGIHINTMEGKVQLAAGGDAGVRLARRVLTHHPTRGVDMIVSAKWLMLARKAISGDEITIHTNDNDSVIILSDERATLFVRSISGKFPDLSRHIPTTYTTRIVVEVSELLAVLRLASPFAKEDANRLTFALSEIADREGRLGILASAKEIGTHAAALDCLASGDPIEIKLHVEHLAEAVTACKTKDIAIEFRMPTMPVAVRPVDGGDLVHMIVPFTK